MFRPLIYIILCLLICNQPLLGQKKGNKKESSFLKDNYHNITARYNGYFNAKLKLNTIISETEKEVKDDYDKILSIFPAQEKMDPSSIGKEMDVIIEKTTTVIQKHPESKWVDDCFYLMGLAHLYKQEYEKAIKSFLYISSSYKPDKSKSKKKKKNKRQHKIKNAKEKSSWDKFIDNHIKHQPIYYKALISLIKTYIAMGEFSKAETITDLIKNDENYPEEYKRELLLTQAHAFIKNNKLEKSIDPLHEAFSMTKKKVEKNRLLFIEGQIHELLDNNDLAIKRFNQLLGLNPDHEMTFQTKLNLAKIYKSADMSMSKIRQMLLEMIRDDKNIDKLDVLYYLLAEIEKDDFNVEKAISYLNSSVSHSMSNEKQKGLSYIMAGDIYYGMETYRTAYAYYDSALSILPKDFENISDIEFRSNTLGKLVIHLDVIEYQDSMQYLASLSESALDEVIDEIIEKKLAELEALEEAEAQEENQQSLDQNNKTTSFNSGKDWYFYNKQAKSNGLQSFFSVWGKRKLEDHWRRSDKSSEFSDASNDAETNNSLSKEEAIMDREQYKENIPFSKEAMSASNDSLARALFESGSIYFKKLENIPLALESFKKLMNKIPKNNFLPETYYQMHLIHKRKKNLKQARYYKSLLLKNFPEHPLSKQLSKKKDDNEDENINRKYEAVFKLFKQDSFQLVVNKVEDLTKTYPNSIIDAKLKLIEAISLGKMDSTLLMVLKLESIVKDYPEKEEAITAKKLLSLISNNPEAIKSKNVNELYILNANETHFFVIIGHKDIFKTSNISVEIANFNESEHKNKKLSVSNIQYDKDHKMVVVKSFENMNEGRIYYENISSKKTLSSKNLKKTHVFIIGQKNFTKLLKEQNVEDYSTFFSKNYLKAKKG